MDFDLPVKSEKARKTSPLVADFLTISHALHLAVLRDRWYRALLRRYAKSVCKFLFLDQTLWRERTLLTRTHSSCDHYGILFTGGQRGLGILAAKALEESTDTRPELWASITSAESVPVGDGRRERDLTSLEEKRSVFILATDGTLRRFGLPLGTTKSEWAISKKIYRWLERDGIARKSQRTILTWSILTDFDLHLDWNYPTVSQFPRPVCRYTDCSIAKIWHWPLSRWRQNERQLHQE